MPGPEAFQATAANGATAAGARFRDAWRRAGKPGIGLALLLLVLAACARAVDSTGFSALESLITTIMLCVPGLAWTGWC